MQSLWTGLPLRTRRIALLAALAVGALWAASVLRATLPSQTDDAQAAAEAARAEWAAILRRAPEPLRDAAAGALEPGDAERPDGRYEDYYVIERTDSTAFALVLTSDAFEPDLSVSTPWGAVRAASALLRTPGRAEITALRGPGRFDVTVTSREREAAGAYDLRVIPQTALDSLVADDPPRRDSLGSGSLHSGRYERTFELRTGSDAPVVVTVASATFRPRVELLGPAGEVVGPYRMVERAARGDSLFGVVLRYLPGWDAPYRLRVSSEKPGAQGRFAVDVRRVTVLDLRADGRPVAGELGDRSWIDAGRYVDTYRLQVPDGAETVLEVTSQTVAPALRLTRLGAPLPRSGDVRPAAEALNAAGALSARIAQTLPGGEYRLEVLSGGAVADSTRPAGGAYALVARVERPEPVPRAPEARPPAAASQQFGSASERTGSSGGSTFAVGVTNVAVSYPGGRTRVQLSVSVRSMNYTGPWAAWSSFASKAFLVDDTGRRYAPAPAESLSPSGPAAEPGTVRRGTVVFYAPEQATGQTRFVLVASVGEATVSVPVSVPN